MDFGDTAPIYRQVAGYIEEMILKKTWKEGERIPSVRDMSIRFRINPNTVNKGFTYLQERDIIRIRRGIGYFVNPGALERVKRERKERFIRKELPELFRTMNLLDMDPAELKRLYDAHEKNGITGESV